jgi:hypothetical protein
MLTYPVASLEIARSNLAYPARILLLGLHAFGTVFGLAYNSRTPDLYRNSSHPSLAWTLSAVAILESTLGIVRGFSRSHSTRAAFDARRELQPLVSSSRPFQDSEESLDDDQIHATDPTYCPSLRESRTNRTNSMRADSHTRRNFAFFPSRAAIDGRYKRPFAWTKSWSKMTSAGRFGPIVAFTSSFLVTVAIILAFVSFCTGTITMAGIFVRSSRLLRLATR